MCNLFAIIENDQRFRPFQTPDQRFDRGDTLFVFRPDCARDGARHQRAIIQRGEIDKLGDIAGYNGDGASLFLNPGVASMVSEYGSTIGDRPGTYAPGWGNLPDPPDQQGSTATYPWRYKWRSGEAISPGDSAPVATWYSKG